MNESDADGAVMATMRLFAERQCTVVDSLAVLSVTAACLMRGLPPDQQDAVLRGFTRAVSHNLASMQGRLDPATAGEGQQ